MEQFTVLLRTNLLPDQFEFTVSLISCNRHEVTFKISYLYPMHYKTHSFSKGFSKKRCLTVQPVKINFFEVVIIVL